MELIILGSLLVLELLLVSRANIVNVSPLCKLCYINRCWRFESIYGNDSLLEWIYDNDSLFEWIYDNDSLFEWIYDNDSLFEWI